VLLQATDITGLSIGARDGEIGKVKDIYFDAERWTVRYLVVDAGTLLVSHNVLISPISITGIDWDEKRVAVNLTQEQVRGAPHWDEDRPVSRQQEIDLFHYYGWPYYRPGAYAWGAWRSPSAAAASAPVREPIAPPPEPQGDPNLHSMEEVKGYKILAADDEIGHVEDFLIDEESWEVRYLVIDTAPLWFGRKVLLPPNWARSIDVQDSKLHVEVTREAIENAPDVDFSKGRISRDYEERLYSHYGRTGYW
jgi:sporulation protein YlmC with PRC-barrel domain